MTVNTGEMRRTQRSKVRAVLRVMHGERWVGDILVDARKRIWRHADAIPREIVLKVYHAFTHRADPAGAVAGRDIPWIYSWHLAPTQ
jgi:hypothetical protein